MQLLVLILKKLDLANTLMKCLVKAGVSGGTVLEGSGIAGELMTMEDLPIFGMIRNILAEEDKEGCKVMLFVIKEEQLQDVRNVIHDVINLREPNTGILFSLPISYVEGFNE